MRIIGPIIRIEDLVFQYKKEDTADVLLAVDQVTLHFALEALTPLSEETDREITWLKHKRPLDTYGRSCLCQRLNTATRISWEIRQSAGMVFKPRQLVSSIVEDVAFGPENLGVNRVKSERGWTNPVCCKHVRGEKKAPICFQARSEGLP